MRGGPSNISLIEVKSEAHSQHRVIALVLLKDHIISSQDHELNPS